MSGFVPHGVPRVLACLRAMLLALLCAGCASTPDAERSYGVATDAVVSWETWQLGGVPQDVLVRGRSQAAPAAIVVHGGPGTSETALFRHFVPELEDHFVMVYWDQPGTGRSINDAALQRGLTMQIVLRDLDELVDRVRARFGGRRVVLIGHSWGSALGIAYAAAHAGKVAAYVGTGQVADMARGEAVSYAYAVEQARARGAAGALEDLRRIGPPPHDVDAMLVARKWVERFGGTFAADLSTFGLIVAALREPEATLLDLVRFGRGNRASLEALWPAFRTLDLAAQVPALDVPVLFVLGASDRVTPTPLALDYLEKLRAPCKRALVVPGAAHNVPFEKPSAFVQALAGVAQRVRDGEPAGRICG